MGAYNHITIHETCPGCGKESDILIQTHIASSFDGNDIGRFCFRKYSLGEKMAWWTKDHKLHDTWKQDANGNNLPEVHEACYSTCEICQVDLYAVIVFKNLVPVKILEIGLEENWPDAYTK